jgi:DNA-directed RNA polymerases I, II, and III subunit RPABC2
MNINNDDYDEEKLTKQKEDYSDSDDELIPPPPPPPDDDDDNDNDDDDADDDDDIADGESIISENNESDIYENIYENNDSSRLQPTIIDSDNEFEDDNNDDDDENYLQKFDESIQQQIITDHHPEMKSHNYDEILTLATTVRNEDGTIIDPLHRSVPFITRYEKAKMIGERSKQLSAGALPFIEVEPNVIDEYLIATKEFAEKKIPFIIKRPMPNGGCEYWKMEDLEILV